ncbi:SigE family RNA polymerase sigma factor [Nocardioides sp. LMS-CY]|uniref:SigE family RNA polymerase sigma factor n=1 Tax=Nocardioides sp. (strain LMS-CY) TaxID=2840457 RepID=UPI001C003262|nr:SigE family RNA polymerase sigma factor [Nocardioides sp. LMS-CY]QWF21921.1 SigE family RNA polymerase sigma factor [Nocardioides sp. LMS-CY]
MSKDREFEQFAVARTPQLYRSAYLLCGDRHRAEDLVQETLAKVYVKWGRRIDNPAAYAQTTLVRTYISQQRRRSSHEVPYDDLPESATVDPAEAADLRMGLQDVLDGLVPLDRAVLVLRYSEDLAVAEVADLLGLSPGAVKNRSMRALERARERASR